MSPPNSRWSSLVSFSELLHLFLAYLFPSLSNKKTSSRNLHFFLFVFVLHISASNSLQIFQLIHCKSLWDLTWLVSWGDKCFSLWWTRFHRIAIFGPTESLRYYRNMPLGATDFATGKTVCHIFYISSDPAPLNESCPLQASQFYSLLCTESQGPNLFDRFQEKPSWKLMSKGEREITSKLIIREREITSKESTKGERILKDPIY